MSLNLAPPMIDSLEIVLDLLSRPATSPAEKLFSDSFIKWLRDGDERPLQSALRLRGTPRRNAVALRDVALIRASAALPDQRACTLHLAALAYLERKAAAWQHLAEAPSHATEAERHLWQAARLADLPTSHDAYSRILAGRRG